MQWSAVLRSAGAALCFSLLLISFARSKSIRAEFNYIRLSPGPDCAGVWGVDSNL